MAYNTVINGLNPIHYWELNGNSNDTGTGTTLNGTDTAMTYSADGIVGDSAQNGVFNLDGSIEIASSSDLNEMTSYTKTITAVVYPTLDTLASILMKIGNDTGGFYLGLTAGLIPIIAAVSNSVGAVFYGEPLKIREPTLLTFVFDNGNCKLYQNDKLVIDEEGSVTAVGSQTSSNYIGEGRTIRVDTETFQTYDLHAKLSHVAVWNSALTATNVTSMFDESSIIVTRTLKFINLPNKTELRVYDINDSLALLGGVEFVDDTTGSDISLEFSVRDTVLVRIVLLNVEARLEPFNTDIVLKREDATYDGSLILNTDRTYDNIWYQPIPIENISTPYLTGSTSAAGDVLTMNQGVYTGSGVITYTYKWYRDGSVISGETSLTYTIQAGDLDLPIYCEETADNIISSLSKISNTRTWLDVKLYCIFSNEVGSLVPSTSWAKCNFENEVVNINDAYSNSSGTYSVPEGNYLVIATMKFTDTSNARVTPEGKIVYSGAGEEAPIYGSGYSRNTGNNISWIRSTSFISNASDGDTIEFQFRSDSDTLSGGSDAGYCHIQILQINPNKVAMYNDDGDTSAFSGTTWNSIPWNNTIREDTGLSKSSNSVVLESNKSYLISYGIAFANSSGNRTQRVSKAVIDGSDIPASFSYAYMRDSANEYGDIGNMFIYTTGGSSENLELFSQRGDALSDGTVVRRVSTSSLFVLDITGSKFYTSYDSSANQQVTVTNDLPINVFETETDTNTGILTKVSATELKAATEQYLIMGSSAFVNNTAHSGSTRLTRGMKFNIGGVDQKIGESGSYQRNDQSSTDTWDMAMGTVGVYYMVGNDVIKAISFDAGEDGNNNSYTVADKCGFWALDINSL